MKNIIITSMLIASAVSHAQAQPVDIIGGKGSDSAQTTHHCGFLPTGNGAGFGFASYTTSPLTTRLVQKKLNAAGFYHGAIDGQFGPASQAATRAFQADYQLPVTGMVDGTTASRLAYATHPAVNVRRCYGQTEHRFR
jgi:hypothetical protein